MNFLQAAEQKILDVLLTDNSLSRIRFYSGFSRNRVSVPLRGVSACVFLNNLSLMSGTASGMTAQNQSGHLCSFTAEIKVYTNTSSGGGECVKAMGDIADVLLKKSDELNMSFNCLRIVPVDFQRDLNAFTGSVLFELSAFANDEGDESD